MLAHLEMRNGANNAPAICIWWRWWCWWWWRRLDKGRLKSVTVLAVQSRLDFDCTNLFFSSLCCAASNCFSRCGRVVWQTRLLCSNLFLPSRSLSHNHGWWWSMTMHFRCCKVTPDRQCCDARCSQRDRILLKYQWLSFLGEKSFLIFVFFLTKTITGEKTPTPSTSRAHSGAELMQFVTGATSPGFN